MYLFTIYFKKWWMVSKSHTMYEPHFIWKYDSAKKRKLIIGARDDEYYYSGKLPMKNTLILTSDIVLDLDGISVWPWQKVVIPTTRTRRGCVSTMPAPTFRLTLEKENNRWRAFIQKFETEKAEDRSWWWRCRLTIL